LNYTFHTIDLPASAEFRDRGSRFIAYVYPISTVEKFKEKLAGLKKEHPKAVHHCFAYRIGTNQDIFRSSDDGEPSGCAGRPILGQIDSKQLTNVLVVVVRYFGGTLLGVPGLINAYKTSTALALEKCSIIEKPILVNYELQFDYTAMNDIMRVVKLFDCQVSQQDLQLFCIINIGVPLKIETDFLNMLKDIRNIQVSKLEN
jgi:uncharacterized YigZ family protein